MAARKATVETRTLRVHDNKGAFEITIPADWRVTFSGFQQGNKYGDGESALRIYEAENKQRACFKGVRSFFDTSIGIQREVITESGESSWVKGPDGYEQSEKVTRKRSKGEY